MELVSYHLKLVDLADPVSRINFCN